MVSQMQVMWRLAAEVVNVARPMADHHLAVARLP